MALTGTRVTETSTSTGTGNITLAGATTGRVSCNAAFGVGPAFFYVIEGLNADGTPSGQWEVGENSLASATVLTRNSGGVRFSSNANALVNFTSASLLVFSDVPGRQMATWNANTGGTNTRVPFGAGSGVLNESANFTYDSATNTLTLGNVTGTALGMTIQTKAPTVLENPGALTLAARAATKANTSGGTVVLTAGDGTGTARGGGLEINSGSCSGSGAGGDFVLTAGNGGSGGGNFSLTAGVANDAGGVGGAFVLQGGPAYGAGGIGGDFTFLPGFGAGRSGFIGIQPPSGATFCFQGSDDGANTTIRFFAVGDGSDLVPQQTTAIASASRTAVGGAAVNTNDTFGGYTIGQVVTALKAYGLLA